jgi:hypothetical protein
MKSTIPYSCHILNIPVSTNGHFLWPPRQNKLHCGSFVTHLCPAKLICDSSSLICDKKSTHLWQKIHSFVDKKTSHLFQCQISHKWAQRSHKSIRIVSQRSHKWIYFAWAGIGPLKVSNARTIPLRLTGMASRC